MQRRALLAEWLILAALVCYRTIGGTMHAPDRLLVLLFSPLPELRFPELRPWLSLFLGVGNIFLLLALLLIFSHTRWAERARWLVTGWFVFSLVIVPVLRDVEIRRNLDEAPGNTLPYRSQAHDGGVLQTELAAASLRRGENPYRADYSHTSMARTADSDEVGWRSTGYQQNPAFTHLPYLPGILYLAVLATPLGDIRLLYLLCALAFAILFARQFGSGPERRSAALIALGNPLFIPYLIIGRNEILLMLPLFLFCRFVLDERWRAAAWALGVALCLKQFAVAAVPFFLLAHPKPRDVWPLFALPLAVCLPFLIWDARAFLDGAIFWSLGGGADPYPVKWLGWGLSPLAYGLNLVESPRGKNPLGFLALPAQLAALLLLGRRVWRDHGEILISTGVFLFIMLFTARAFAFNYLIVPALFVAMAGRSHEPA